MSPEIFLSIKIYQSIARHSILNDSDRDYAASVVVSNTFLNFGDCYLTHCMEEQAISRQKGNTTLPMIHMQPNAGPSQVSTPLFRL